MELAYVIVEILMGLSECESSYHVHIFLVELFIVPLRTRRGDSTAGHSNGASWISQVNSFAPPLIVSLTPPALWSIVGFRSGGNCGVMAMPASGYVG